MVLVVRPVPLPGIVGVRRCKGAIPRSRTEAESKSDPRGVFVISGGFVTFCEIVRNDPDENSMLLIVLGCPVGKTTRHQGGADVLRRDSRERFVFRNGMLPARKRHHSPAATPREPLKNGFVYLLS